MLDIFSVNGEQGLVSRSQTARLSRARGVKMDPPKLVPPKLVPPGTNLDPPELVLLQNMDSL